MKRLLKYIIPLVLVVIAFVGATTKVDCADRMHMEQDIILPSLPSVYDYIASDSHLYFPLRTSGANIFTVNTLLQRRHSSHENTYEYFKACKVSPTDISLYVSKSFLIVHFFFIKPFHRLISFGKLLL